ncbi:hypothetical protein BASA81_000241 [Batrachochytrium salamandrivorans]|nr:hypothetical protein BASA81_000241 [Batrachochytrium salamandrivorans]
MISLVLGRAAEMWRSKGVEAASAVLVVAEQQQPLQVCSQQEFDKLKEQFRCLEQQTSQGFDKLKEQFRCLEQQTSQPLTPINQVVAEFPNTQPTKRAKRLDLPLDETVVDTAAVVTAVTATYQKGNKVQLKPQVLSPYGHNGWVDSVSGDEVTMLFVNKRSKVVNVQDILCLGWPSDSQRPRKKSPHALQAEDTNLRIKQEFLEGL